MLAAEVLREERAILGYVISEATELFAKVNFYTLKVLIENLGISIPNGIELALDHCGIGIEHRQHFQLAT